jgi:hypothetical protein
MRSQTTFLLAMVTAAIALALVAAGSWAIGDLGGDRRVVALPPRSAPKVDCERPRALRLIRFEDGSARLQCGRRLLVRVSGPR